MKPQFLYDLYERELATSIERVPRHIGVILDGNRRWARSVGTGADHGHRRGADKITEFLEWSEKAGVEVVTLWMLSTDNLARKPEELADLLQIIVQTVRNLADQKRFHLNIVGELQMLAPNVAQALRQAQCDTSQVEGIQVNVAIGYGGRQEIVEAVRELLEEQSDKGRTLAEVAADLSAADITEHLYTKGQPDPDLVIRTSGEQRLSGFLLWQSAHSEYYFCEAYWPEFRKVDFLRALRDYSQRDRRLGR